MAVAEISATHYVGLCTILRFLHNNAKESDDYVIISACHPMTSAVSNSDNLGIDFILFYFIGNLAQLFKLCAK
jgi:hypothetical protein